MKIHILCLNILILLFTFSPVILTGIIFEFLSMSNKKQKQTFFLKYLFYILVLETIFINFLNSNLINIKLINTTKWYLLAILISPFNVLIEVLINFLIIKFSGKKVGKISFLTSSKSCKNKTIILSMLVAIFEEMIFRDVWFGILKFQFKFNIIFVILICAIVYGLNHIFIGKKVVIQKIFSGTIYGTLYFLSGSIIIPIITHCVQNLIVLRKGCID